MLPKEFYIVPEDIFRLGNATGSRLSNVRLRDIKITKINGINVVIANGKGVCVFDKEGINLSPMSEWVWYISKNIPLPKGLKLVKDKKHHYCVAPTKNMPVDKYKGLLVEMALRAKKFIKKKVKRYGHFNIKFS